jgi:phage terminase large subunit
MTAPLEVTVDTPAVFDFLYDPPLGQLRYRGSYGGRGSAKSWQFARALLIHGAQRPLRILCVREFQSSIRDSVHRLLADQVDAVGLAGFYTIGVASILGANGTEFLFKGLRRDVAEIKSTEGIDICWVEEAQAVSDTSWQVLIPTVRKEGSEIWVTWNPMLETDPTQQRFAVNPPPRSIIRKVSFRDNPFLTSVLAEEEAQLFKVDPEAHANVWEGEVWRRSHAEVLAGKWIVDDFTPAAHWEGPYYGADWGFSQDPSTLVRMWRADSRLYLEHQEGGILLDMDDTERRFRRVPGAEDHTIRADSARPETINEMRRRGLRVIPAPKWDGSIKDGIEHLRSYERIVIHSRCTLAIQEARLYRYKTDPKTNDPLPALVDAHNHTWDAVRYGLAPFIRQRIKPQLLVPGAVRPDSPPEKPGKPVKARQVICRA